MALRPMRHRLPTPFIALVASISLADVWAAYSNTMKAADRNGTVAETRERIKALVAGEAPGGFAARVLCGEVGP